MIKHTELETKQKLHKLETVMNDTEIGSDFENHQEEKQYNQQKQNKKRSPKEKTFKTIEVVALVIITTIVSLILGALVSYRVFNNQGELVEKELQEFIKNYEYIVDNYNGDIDKEKLLDAALEGMLNTLDKNSTFLDSDSSQKFNTFLEGKYNGIGIEVYNDEKQNIIVNRVFKGSPADKAGLRAGDILIKMNNQSIKNTKLNKFISMVAKEKDKKITLIYIRDKKEKKAVLTRSNINLKSVGQKTYTQGSKKIGYIQISIFASNTYEQFKETLEKTKKENVDSLIIDLRGNSGGYLSTAEKILSLFLDSSHPIYQIQKQGVTTKYYSKGKKNETIKVAILVDGSSASASEILTSALKEQYGAVVIGQKTYGKGTVQEMQNLTDGDKYKLTTKNWLTSKGAWVDKKGIEPNIKVELSEKYIQNPNEENDNQLQTALKELSK